MKMLRCTILLRPTLPGVEAACGELRMGKYSSYHVVFCGPTTPEHLDLLARADTDCLVEQVEEVFCDFDVVNHDAFLLMTQPPRSLLSTQVSNAQVHRVVQGLASLIVAHRCKPIIRYQKSSAYAHRVATELVTLLRGDPELYDYRNRSRTLLILDRCDDPLTALLTPWTYQAMLHEYIGLHANTLRLPSDVDGAEKDGYVFSESDDAFFAQNAFSNWGDLCNNVKRYVDQCKSALQLDRSTATLEELKTFMQNIPQTKALTGSVTKHTTVTTYLSSVLKRRNMLQVSLLEQDMNASDSQSDHWRRLQELAASELTDSSDLTRLCLIYYLRYEATSNQKSQVIPYLDRISSTHALLLPKLRKYYFGTTNQPVDRLFAATGVMAAIVKTFADVGNIYTQHEPVLKKTLLQLYRGELDEGSYPYMAYLAPAGRSSSGGGGAASAAAALQATGTSGVFKPQDAMVYMCGGYTYEEAALIRAVNNRAAFKPSDVGGFVEGNDAVRASIGGEMVLTTRNFLHLLEQLPSL